MLAGRSSRHPVVRSLALGPVVWLSGHVVLPLAGVYKPIGEYDARTLADDLSAHLVFGLTSSARVRVDRWVAGVAGSVIENSSGGRRPFG